MILIAALKVKDESFKPDGFLIVPCLRHGFGYSMLHDLTGKHFKQSCIEEGFINTKGRFYNRVEAYQYATHCGQLSASTRELKRRNSESELYSEDLY
nr:MAG TPA: hypothetical protein [Caudoviricetes sp.]